MEFIPEWAPNIHPVIVHFPIAIIFLAAFLDFVTGFVSDKWWDAFKTSILYVLGSIALIITYYSGTLAGDSVFVPAGAQTVLNEHADWAWWTLWFFGLYTLGRLVLHRYDVMDKKWFNKGAFLFVLPGLFMLYETGDHGAEMVFGYGTGTGQLVQEQDNRTLPADSLQNESTSIFNQFGNGDWSWEIGSKGVSTLLSRFQWLEGSADELKPSVMGSNGNYFLRLNAGGSPNFFVKPETLQEVQVDYYLDLSQYEGEISLVYYFHDTQNYDFVTLQTDGTITQGRMREGEAEIFEEETYSASGMMFVRTVGNGTHYRAYINKELKVHGHGDAPSPGQVGIRLDGKGYILIDRITLTQLN